jgi:hypothetical protein
MPHDQDQGEHNAVGVHAAGVPDVGVLEHRWGCEAEGPLAEPFDVIVACGEYSSLGIVTSHSQKTSPHGSHMHTCGAVFFTPHNDLISLAPLRTH